MDPIARPARRVQPLTRPRPCGEIPIMRRPSPRRLAWISIATLALACTRDEAPGAESKSAPVDAAAKAEVEGEGGGKADPDANAEGGEAPAPDIWAKPDLPPEPAVPPLGEDPEPVLPEQAATPEDRAQLERTGELGRDLVSALRAGDVDAAIEMTPYGQGEWSRLCAADTLDEGIRELRARLNHCTRAIKWDQVSDVRIAGGEPTGETAEDCKGDIEAFAPITLLVVQPGPDYEINLRGVYGRKETAAAFSGSIACETRQ